jgi:hypothetical protein
MALPTLGVHRLPPTLTPCSSSPHAHTDLYRRAASATIISLRRRTTRHRHRSDATGPPTGHVTTATSRCAWNPFLPTTGHRAPPALPAHAPDRGLHHGAGSLQPDHGAPPTPPRPSHGKAPRHPPRPLALHPPAQHRRTGGASPPQSTATRPRKPKAANPRLSQSRHRRSPRPRPPPKHSLPRPPLSRPPRPPLRHLRHRRPRQPHLSRQFRLWPLANIPMFSPCVKKCALRWRPTNASSCPNSRRCSAT